MASNKARMARPLDGSGTSSLGATVAATADAGMTTAEPRTAATATGNAASMLIMAIMATMDTILEIMDSILDSGETNPETAQVMEERKEVLNKLLSLEEVTIQDSIMEEDITQDSIMEGKDSTRDTTMEDTTAVMMTPTALEDRNAAMLSMGENVSIQPYGDKLY